MPVAVFSRSHPDRNRSAGNWREVLRAEHFALSPGRPDLPLEGKTAEKTAELRQLAGAHETTLVGLVHLCKSCRRGTRDSLWLVRCGPCGEYFSPVLTLFSSCDGCGGPAEAMRQLEAHCLQLHGSGLHATQ